MIVAFCFAYYERATTCCCCCCCRLISCPEFVPIFRRISIEPFWAVNTVVMFACVYVCLVCCFARSVLEEDWSILQLAVSNPNQSMRENDGRCDTTTTTAAAVKQRPGTTTTAAVLFVGIILYFREYSLHYSYPMIFSSC